MVLKRFGKDQKRPNIALTNLLWQKMEWVDRYPYLTYHHKTDTHLWLVMIQTNNLKRII
jgi:hypothetical protein